MLEPSRRTHRSAIEALELTGRYAAGNLSHYPPGEHVPAHPELRGDWEPLITQTDKRGRPRTVRMAHEAATFRELQERLRCKEIWVVGAAAIAAATDAHGEGGSKMRGAWMTEAPAAFRAMFAQGLEGCADQPSYSTRARSAATSPAGASVRSRSTCQQMAGSPSSSQPITLTTAGYPAAG